MSQPITLLPGMEHLREEPRPARPAPLGVPRTSISYVEKPRLITTAEEAWQVAACLLQQRMAWVGLDTEFRVGTGGPRSMVLRTVQLSPAVARDGGYEIWRGLVFDVSRPGIIEPLAKLLRQPWRFVTHYARAEYESLKAANLPVPGDLFDTHLAARQCSLGAPDWRNFLDPNIEGEGEVEIMAARGKAAEEQEKMLGLVGLCRRYDIEHRYADRKKEMQERFGSGAPLDDQMVAYAAEDARVVAALYLPVVQQLAVQGLLRHFEQIELPALPVFLNISWDGISVDPSRLQRVVAAAEPAVEHFAEELRSRAATLGVALDRPGSPVQRLILMRALGLAQLFRRGRTGSGKVRYSFKRDVLKRHRDRHPAVEALYRYSLLARIPSDKLFQGAFTDPDGRVRSRLEPLGAATGRPSFRAPNLASVARIFRPAFVADDSEQAIVEIDFKAQEPGLAAAHYGDAAMLGAWNGAGDFYTRMGRDLQVEFERWRLKLLVLAALYGQTDWSTAESLGMEVFQARKLLGRFFGQYPALAAGMKEAEDLAHVRGFAETRSGLKRYLNMNLPRHARGRQARNLPVQGGGADVLKLLLPRAHAYLRQLGGRVLVPLFDSLVFQVPRAAQWEAVKIIGHEMIMAMQALYPELHPKLDINDGDTTCWNKDGHGDAIERFEENYAHDIK